MNAREEIFGRIRRSLSVPSDDSTRQAAVSERLAKKDPALIPARGQLNDKQRITLFCEQAENVQSTTVRVASADDVPEAIAAYLRDHNLPSSLRMGDDQRLTKLDWHKAPSLDRVPGPSDGRDQVGLAHAFAGVAETGTLLMTSGAENPTTNNFLPDNHIVVVDGKDITGDYETAWARLRERGGMPRTVNMITGPSRSADIEQTLLLGAHGPRSLHIIVIDPD